MPGGAQTLAATSAFAIITRMSRPRPDRSSGGTRPKTAAMSSRSPSRAALMVLRGRKRTTHRTRAVTLAQNSIVAPTARMPNATKGRSIPPFSKVIELNDALSAGKPTGYRESTEDIRDPPYSSLPRYSLPVDPSSLLPSLLDMRCKSKCRFEPRSKE